MTSVWMLVATRASATRCVCHVHPFWVAPIQSWPNQMILSQDLESIVHPRRVAGHGYWVAERSNAANSTDFVLRATCFPMLRRSFPENSKLFWRVSSGICLAIGTLCAWGAALAWARL